MTVSDGVSPPPRGEAGAGSARSKAATGQVSKFVRVLKYAKNSLS